MCDRHEITLEFLPHFSHIPVVQLKFEKRMETQKNKQNMFFWVSVKGFILEWVIDLHTLYRLAANWFCMSSKHATAKLINIRTTIIRSEFKNACAVSLPITLDIYRYTRWYSQANRQSLQLNIWAIDSIQIMPPHFARSFNEEKKTTNNDFQFVVELTYISRSLGGH